MASEFSSNGCDSGGGERFRPWQRLRGQRAFRRERNVGVYRHSAAALVRILPPWEAETGNEHSGAQRAADAGALDTKAASDCSGATDSAGASGNGAGERAEVSGGNLAKGWDRGVGNRLAKGCGCGTGRRLGVVASRKVGNAVARNRAKRVWREVFRLNQHLLPVDCDVLVIVRKDFASAQRADVEALFADAARRARRAFGGG